MSATRQVWQRRLKPRGALSSYQTSLAIRERLAAADPSSTVWQRDVWVSLWKLHGLPESGVSWRDIAQRMEIMKANGTLLPTDEQFLQRARAEAEAEAAR